MTRKRFEATLLGLASCVFAAACSSGDGQPPGLGESFAGSPLGRTDASAVQPADASKDASNDAAWVDVDASEWGDVDAGIDAARASADADSAPTSDAAGDVADVQVSPGTDAAMAQPSCNPTATWSTPAVVRGLSFPAQALVTMTGDERTVAWVLDAGNGVGNVFVADRTTSADPFGSAMQLRPSTGGSGRSATADAGAGSVYFAFDRVGLSADGLTLVGVATDGLGMAEFTRTDRGQAFFPFPQPSAYVALVRPLMAGEVLGDPVLSEDGDDIVYSRYGQSHTVSVYEAFRSGPVAWGGGSPRQSQPLQMAGGLRKRPTALSADRLTLFVWDEATSAAYGLFRSDPMGDFNGAQPYGQRFSLQANSACTSLYFVAPSASGYALYQITAM
jgi:hypothetical protein